jgi:hypothetical protein
METRAMRGLDAGAKMIEQGFHFPPMDVGTDRVMENAAELVGVLVAHFDCPDENKTPS